MSLYLSSTDLEVIAAVEQNRTGRKEFLERSLAWAKERGADEFFPSTFAGRLSIRGLPIAPEGFGRWTKPDHRGCHRPFRNNTAELEVIAAINFTAQPVPGLPDALTSVMDRDGRAYLMWPTPFVHDGTAWVSYDYQPDPSEADKIGPQWTERLASHYYAAKEAVSAAQEPVG